MLEYLDLEALSQEMRMAQDTGRSVETFTSRFPDFDLEAAYKVARLIHRARITEGARPVGRKIGFTNPDMWSEFGVRAPIWAHLYDTTVSFIAGTQTSCPLDGLAEPKIEPEIVFRFRESPPADARIADVLNAVDWVAHGFEIVQSHFSQWRFRAPDTVADQALHGMLLIGPPQPLSELGEDPVTALESFSLVLSCDGREIERGNGRNVLDNPLAAVAHLVSVLAKQPESLPLQPGEIVTTGTITTARSVHAGESWSSEVEGAPLPGLTISFEK